MSDPQEKAEYLRQIYSEMAESPGGIDHMRVLKKEAAEAREAAAKLEPIIAWGRLQFADGLERAVAQIQQMQLLGKRNLKE